MTTQDGAPDPDRELRRAPAVMESAAEGFAQAVSAGDFERAAQLATIYFGAGLLNQDEREDA